MLSLPAEAGPDIIRILGCDPGTTTLGLALMEIHLDDMHNPKIVWAHTLKVTNPKDEDDLFKVDGGRAWRVEELGRQLTEIIEWIRPTFFATETPFMKRGKMSAYESGIELQIMIRESIRNVSLTLKVYGINPIMVKHFVGVDHIKTDKDDVRNAVIGLFNDTATIDLTLTDEHSNDAVAVTNWFYRHELSELPPLFIRVKKPGSKGTRKRRRRKKS